MSSLERLLAVIDAYGADPARWPEAERAGLEAVARAPEASRLLAEARALDAVLARSPALDAGVLDDLKSRIVAKADESGRVTQRPAMPRSVTSLGDRRRMPVTQSLRAAWPAAAALAASLLVGAFFGASEMGKPAVENLMASAGYDTTDQLTLDPLGVGDEELL